MWHAGGDLQCYEAPAAEVNIWYMAPKAKPVFELKDRMNLTTGRQLRDICKPKEQIELKM